MSLASVAESKMTMWNSPYRRCASADGLKCDGGWKPRQLRARPDVEIDGELFVERAHQLVSKRPRPATSSAADRQRKQHDAKAARSRAGRTAATRAQQLR